MGALAYLILADFMFMIGAALKVCRADRLNNKKKAADWVLVFFCLLLAFVVLTLVLAVWAIADG